MAAPLLRWCGGAVVRWCGGAVVHLSNQPGSPSFHCAFPSFSPRHPCPNFLQSYTGLPPSQTLCLPLSASPWHCPPWGRSEAPAPLISLHAWCPRHTRVPDGRVTLGLFPKCCVGGFVIAVLPPPPLYFLVFPFPFRVCPPSTHHASVDFWAHVLLSTKFLHTQQVWYLANHNPASPC